MTTNTNTKRAKDAKKAKQTDAARYPLREERLYPEAPAVNPSDLFEMQVIAWDRDTGTLTVRVPISIDRDYISRVRVFGKVAR